MAFQSVEKIVGVDSTETPWLNEYLEENPDKDGMTFIVREIVEVKSGKGYLLKTPSFNCFCWKKDKAINYVLEKIDDSREMSVPLNVAIKADVSSKNNFRLLLDEDEGFIWSKDGELLQPSFEGKIFKKDDPNLPPPLPAINTPPARKRRAR